MNTPLLIHSVVRQVTVLLAQLGTAGGVRAPMSHLANQVFLNLAEELESQGVSRKVSADMFGMALRAYVRKVSRLREGQTSPGVTLWQAVLEFIRDNNTVLRSRVLERFGRDPESVLLSILHDLCESGLVFVLGSGNRVAYRAASDKELSLLAGSDNGEGLHELVWALIVHEGPLEAANLERLVARTSEELTPVVEALVSEGRVEKSGDGLLSARDLVIPLSDGSGWEAAVFDHFQAVVNTICQRLQGGSPNSAEAVGGSTYRFDVWPEHPLWPRVQAQLDQIRTQLTALREEVSSHNRQVGIPENYRQVALYVGQCQLDREEESPSTPSKASSPLASEKETP